MSLDLSQPAPEPASGRRRVLAVAVALGFAGLILALFVGAGRKPPVMSATLEHRAALGGRDARSCLGCHAQGAAPARPKGHTGRQDCWSCHAVGGN